MPDYYIYKPKKPMIPITTHGYYGVAHVMFVTGWSRSNLYRKIQIGEFPKPEICGKTKQKVYWKTSTVKEALGL